MSCCPEQGAAFHLTVCVKMYNDNKGILFYSTKKSQSAKSSILSTFPMQKA